MFGCHKKGHVVSECPDKNKESSRVIQAESTTHSTSTETAATDLWIQVLIVLKEDDPEDNHSAKLVGPT